MKKKYIEIVERQGDIVVERMDVTGDSERSIGQIRSGISINLNHLEYLTRVREYDKEMPKSDEK